MITQRFAVEFDRRTVGIARPSPRRLHVLRIGRPVQFNGRAPVSRARAIERQLKRAAKRDAHKTQVRQVSALVA